MTVSTFKPCLILDLTVSFHIINSVQLKILKGFLMHERVMSNGIRVLRCSISHGIKAVLNEGKIF